MGTERGNRMLAGLAGLAVAVTLAGCGDDARKQESFGSHLLKKVELVVQGDNLQGTFDAAATPDGRTVFFTATGPNGPGVFRVPATGGRAEAVTTGSPFQRPVGIAVSTDGAKVYVADTVARTNGVVFAIPVAAGSQAGPSPVQGTEGTAPRGIEVVREAGGDVVYFTGKDRIDGTGGAFKVPAAGAPAPTEVLKGSPLIDPDAVTVTKTGVVYVTDRGAGADTGAVYRVKASSAVEKIADIRAPKLAGVTLTQDESTLLVSALSDKGTDQVVVIDVVTLRTGTFSKTIGENRDGGGLHRAHDVNVFTWADVSVRGGGVYVLTS